MSIGWPFILVGHCYAIVIGPRSPLGDDLGDAVLLLLITTVLLKSGRPQGVPARGYFLRNDRAGWDHPGEVGLALGVSAVTLITNTLPRVLVMLSELATCLYALTATREYGMGPLRRQFRSWWSGCRSSALSARARVSGIPPESKGLGGLGPGRVRNGQVCGGWSAEDPLP